MSDLAIIRTANALDQVLAEMESMAAHPRIQQNRWVAQARVWLPIIRQAKADLLTHAETGEITWKLRSTSSPERRDAVTLRWTLGEAVAPASVKWTVRNDGPGDLEISTTGSPPEDVVTLKAGDAAVRVWPNLIAASKSESFFFVKATRNS